MTNEEIMEIIDNDDAWDTGALGRDEKFARLVKLTPEQEINLNKIYEDVGRGTQKNHTAIIGELP